MFTPPLLLPRLQGGTLLVDGVLASDQSDWLLDDVVPPGWHRHLPALYGTLLAPVRLAYRVLGPAGVAAVDGALGASRLGHRCGVLVSAVATGGAGLPLAASALAALAAAVLSLLKRTTSTPI